MIRLRLARDILRAEGLRGLAERLADRVESMRDRKRERAVEPERLAEALAKAGGAPVLDVLATPLAPRFGGVPVQLGARLAEERRLRPTALLSPEGGWWTLRTAHGSERRRARLGRVVAGGDPARGLGSTVETVVEAAGLAGARVVNVEGAAGWPPEALLSLAGCGRKLVVSLHDFALFCPRPHLVEEPRASFCGYARDADRCSACLAATWSLPADFVEGWRNASTDLLSTAEAVVYPSEFLRRQHAALFPEATPRREHVIAPAVLGGSALTGADPSRRRVRPAGSEEPFRIAFVGAYRPHKGALVFEELLRRETGRAGRPVRWSILGSGDSARLLAARQLGAHVTGHYRAGGLARLLREEGIDVALLLSIWPEAFAMTLSECRAAGVPVVAFAHGAIADRIAEDGGGLLVRPEDGAGGIAAALEQVRTRALQIPRFRGLEPGASASRAATERIRLYRTLLDEAT